MCTELNLSERFGVLYWLIFDSWSYDSYQYWLSIGVKPKYAYEKTKNRL